MKRIVLIEPMSGTYEKEYYKRNNSCVSSGSPVALREPIAVEYIGGYLSKLGYDIIIIQQRELSVDQLVDEILKNKPDAIGVSVHATYIFNETLYLANEIKKVNPSTMIFFGGNHPTGFPYIVKEESIDYVVLGEGEETTGELLEKYFAGEKTDEIKGIAFEKDGKVVITKGRERLKFSELPWPLRDKKILDTCKCAPLSYPIPSAQYSAAQVSYSRGCTGGCKFCVSNYLWKQKLSFRKTEDVINELKFLKKKYNTNFFFLTDLTFNENKKKALEFCSALIESDLNMNWFAYCNVSIDEELAKQMHIAGCSRIGFGLEAVVDDALKVVKPAQNVKQIEETLKMTDSLGIINRCYLMIGYPWETEEYLQKTNEIIKKLAIDQVRIGFVVPFPGTAIFNDWEDIRDKNFNNYTGDRPTIHNERISYERYLEIRDDIVRDFYNNPEYWMRVDDKIKNYLYLKNSYDYFRNYLIENNILLIR